MKKCRNFFIDNGAYAFYRHTGWKAKYFKNSFDRGELAKTDYRFSIKKNKFLKFFNREVSVYEGGSRIQLSNSAAKMLWFSVDSLVDKLNVPYYKIAKDPTLVELSTLVRGPHVWSPKVTVLKHFSLGLERPIFHRVPLESFQPDYDSVAVESKNFITTERLLESRKLYSSIIPAYARATRTSRSSVIDAAKMNFIYNCDDSGVADLIVTGDRYGLTWQRAIRWQAMLFAKAVTQAFIHKKLLKRVSDENAVRDAQTFKLSNVDVSNYDVKKQVSRPKMTVLRGVVVDYTWYNTALFNATGSSRYSSYVNEFGWNIVNVWENSVSILGRFRGDTNFIAERYFYRLHDSRKTRHSLYMAATQTSVGTSNNFSVDNTRGNALFINRFIRHGRQRRAANAFGRAMSLLSVFYKKSILDRSQLAEVAFNLYLTEQVKISTLFDFGRADFNFGQLTIKKYKSDIQSESSLLHTYLSGQFFIKRLWSMAPIYTMVVKRVDKQRYKNSRGKAGRFEMSLVKINSRRRLAVGLQALKLDWIAYGHRTYTARFFRILQLLLLYPEKTWGFKLSQRALAKFEERL